MKNRVLGLLLVMVLLGSTAGCSSDREKGINKEKEKPEPVQEKK